MKKYYAERKGLIKENLRMDFKELLSFFYQTYFYDAGVKSPRNRTLKI